MGKEKLDIAILGLDNANKSYIFNLLKYKTFNLKAIYDKDLNNLKQFSKSLNVRLYTDYRKLVKDNNIDIAIVLVDFLNRYEVIKFLLENNIHILVEKTISLNLNQVEELIDIAKQKKLLIFNVFPFKISKEVIWFKDFYKKNKRLLGNINSFTCEFYDPYVKNNKLNKRAKSLLGSWINIGIDALGVISEFINVDNIRHEERNSTYLFDINPRGDLVEAVIYKFNSKFLGIIKTSWIENKEFKATQFIFDSGKKIILYHSKKEVILIDNNTSTLLAKFKENSFDNKIKYLLKEYKKSTNYAYLKKLYNHFFYLYKRWDINI